MTLLEDFCKLAMKVSKVLDPRFEANETETRRASVVPFFQALGYNANNPREVKEEFRVEDKFVDYAIKRAGKPIIFVEAKQWNEKLSNHWRQLHEYFDQGKVKFAILTNGLNYEFYTDLKEAGRMDEKPFLSFNMRLHFHSSKDQEDSQLAKDLQWFTNAKFDTERILSVARRRTISCLLQKELDQPSHEIINYFASQVSSEPLTEDTRKDFASAIKDAWRELLKYDVSLRKHNMRGGAQIDIFPEYGTGMLNAKLLISEKMDRNDTFVLYGGERIRYGEAALKAHRKVNPRKEKVNGLTFWRFTDPFTGENRPIKDIIDDETLRSNILHFLR